MADNLKEKAAIGIIWKFVGSGGTQFVQFISGIYIARLLSPSDYGLIGMMAIFLGISQMLIDSGFRTTLIQKGDSVTNDDYNVVFIFNIIVSVLLYLILFIFAPVIAKFYNESRLLSIARILGLNLVLISLGIIHQTILEKRLNFRTLSKISLVSIIISVSLGILLAINGFGVWALVVMMLSESFIRVSLLWYINGWYPSFQFKISSFRDLYKKGITIFLAGIVQQIYLNLYPMIIGRYFTTADVGFYSQGRKLQRRISDVIHSSVQGVMYPVQSKIRDNTHRFKNSVRTNVKISTLLAFPAIIGFIAIAEPFILLFLTEKWLSTVYYLQVLSVAGIFFVLSGAISSFILPLGHFGLVVKLSFVNLVVLVLVIVIGLCFNVSLKHLIFGKVIQDFIGVLVLLYYSQKIINYGVSQVCADIFRPLLFSIIMGVTVLLIQVEFGISFFILGIQLLSGVIIYMILNYTFNKRMFLEIFSFLRTIVFKRQN